MRSIFIILMMVYIGGSSVSFAQVSAPSWQASLDTIKAKAKVLIDRNAQLMQEQEGFKEQHKQLQGSIQELQIKNDSLRQLLKQRRGRNDQDMHIEDLKNQIKSREVEIIEYQKEVDQLQAEASNYPRKINLKKLKILDLQNQQKYQKAISKQILVDKDDDELNPLKEKLQFEKDQEELLKLQLGELKKKFRQHDLTEQADEGQFKDLEDKVETLRKQKEGLQKQMNVDNSQAKNKRYIALMARKKDLEKKIKEYEEQLHQFKKPEALGFWDPKQKKQVLKEMIQIDARNAQIRQKITNLKEDTSILKEKVTRLERKMDRAHGSEAPKQEK